MEDHKSNHAYDNRSQAYNNFGFFEEALDDAEKSLSIDPRNPFAIRNKAIALIGSG